MNKYGQKISFVLSGWRKVVSNSLKNKGEMNELMNKAF
jgi:hypothetical protein